MENFNNLSPAETERLALLIEECSEVIHICSKTLRHGYESYHPNNPAQTNRALLECELGDLQHAVMFCCKYKDVDGDKIQLNAFKRNLTIGEYLHHNAIPY